MFSWKFFISSNSGKHLRAQPGTQNMCMWLSALVWAKPEGQHRAAAPQRALCAWLSVVLHHRWHITCGSEGLVLCLGAHRAAEMRGEGEWLPTPAGGCFTPEQQLCVVPW